MTAFVVGLGVGLVGGCGIGMLLMAALSLRPRPPRRP